MHGALGALKFVWEVYVRVLKICSNRECAETDMSIQIPASQPLSYWSRFHSALADHMAA